MDSNGKPSSAFPNQSFPSKSRIDAVKSFGSRLKLSASELLGEVLIQPSPYDDVASLTSFFVRSDKGMSAPTLANASIQELLLQTHKSLIENTCNDERGEDFQSREGPFSLKRPYHAESTAEFTMNIETLTSCSKFHHSLGHSMSKEFSLSQDQANSSRKGLASHWVDEDKRWATSPIDSMFWQTIKHSDLFPRNEDDGAAVVSLLSRPGFSLSQMPDNIEVEEEGHLQDSRDKTEITPLMSFNALSLLPDFNPDNRFMPKEQGRPDLEETYFRILSPNLISKDQGLSHWIDILWSYQDQVWGGMLPLAQLKPKGMEGTSERYLPKSTTVKRLAMIVRHLGHFNDSLLALPPI